MKAFDIQFNFFNLALAVFHWNNNTNMCFLRARLPQRLIWPPPPSVFSLVQLADKQPLKPTVYSAEKTFSKKQNLLICMWQKSTGWTVGCIGTVGQQWGSSICAHTHAHRAEYRSQTLSLASLLTRSKEQIDSDSGCAKPLALSVSHSLTHTHTHTLTVTHCSLCASKRHKRRVRDCACG